MTAARLTYRQALAWLHGLINYERHPPLAPATRAFHLGAFRRFLAALGAPQRRLRIIHIAGTRGKGTVATMLAEALAHRGQRVGLYRSPHVDDLRERITVDGQWIPRAAFARQCARVRAAMPGQPEETFRTFFECLTAIAMLHFAEEAVDWVVLETGLGGRLDATNVVRPRLTVITALGVDHTRVLGSDPVRIAREKAGILKRGVPCVLAPQPPGTPPGAVAAVRARAKALGAPVVNVARMWEWKRDGHTPRGQRVTLRRRGGEEIALDLHLAALAAAPAMATVAAALECLGMPIATANSRRTARNERLAASRAPEIFRWPLAGRFEVVSERPLVVLDGAHCPLAAAHLAETLRALGARRPWRVCLAMMEDKDQAGFIRALDLGPGDAVALPDLRNPRALPPAALAAIVRREADGCEVRAFPRLSAAMAWLTNLRPRGTTVATGTFYHVAALRRLLRPPASPSRAVR